MTFEVQSRLQGPIAMWFFVFVSIIPYAQAESLPPINITGNLDPNVITEGKTTVLTLNFSNSGDLPVNGLDVQIVSNAFKVISEKKLPNTIYPESFIIAQYLLQSTAAGTNPIYITATYFTNRTVGKQYEIKQFNTNHKITNAIVQSGLPEFSAISSSALTTLIGTIIGFAISKATEWFTNRNTERRESRALTQKAKSLLLHNLGAAAENVPRRINVHDDTLDIMASQGLYSPISRDQNLEKTILTLYADLRNYNDAINNHMEYNTNQLLADIATVRSIVSGWD